MKSTRKPWQILDATTLKIIAIIAMTLDHAHKALYPGALWMGVVGRLTLPIMAFFIAEGAAKTGDKRKYLIRLILFALISEVPYDLFVTGHLFDLYSQNTMFTLAFGLIGCYMIDNIKRNENAALSVIAIGGVLSAGMLLRVDYGFAGVLCVMLFYIFKTEKNGTRDAIIIGNGALTLMLKSANQLAGFFALPLLWMYNGERGNGYKYLFYIFYPAHMLALLLLSRL